MKINLVDKLILSIALLGLFAFSEAQESSLPKHYVCYFTSSEISIDGKAAEKAWDLVSWTDYFLDIEGDSKPSPRLKTRAKMLWDDQYLYLYAEMEEPHVWANITQRDAVIFHDNDFEVFIDPDGDTHGYFEFEINALNTVWDLLLIKPYRDGGPVLNDWDFKGLRSAVAIQGTINNPIDKDKGWGVEIAFPLQSFMVYRSSGMPKEGDAWRVNFSRVEWKVKVENGKYSKEINPVSGKPFPEDNWVWSPPGVIDMHQPETWGYLQFTKTMAGKDNVGFIANPEEMIKSELRRIYYAQRNYFEQHKIYAEHLTLLKENGIKPDEFQFHPELKSTMSLYEITAYMEGSPWLWHIDQSGRTWRTRRESGE